MTEKRRYKNYSPEVLSKIQEDARLKDYAKEIRDIYSQKKNPGFELAFSLFDKYHDWKKQNPGWSFRYFLYNLIEVGKLKNKESTLKLSFKVARCFPDLRDEARRRASFDCYREIANRRDLDQTQMNELRQEAEEYGYTGRKIREVVKKMLGENSDREEEPKKLAFQKSITYKDDEQFIKAIKDILEGPDRPKEGAKFLLKKVRR